MCVWKVIDISECDLVGGEDLALVIRGKIVEKLMFDAGKNDFLPTPIPHHLIPFPFRLALRIRFDLDVRLPVAPDPAEDVGEDLGGVLLIVTAFAPGVVHVVAGPGEAAFHHLVRHPPVAAVEVIVASAALEEDAEGLGLEFADEHGQLIGTVNADVGADAGEHTAEAIRAMPGDHEGADAAAAVASDGGVIRIGA